MGIRILFYSALIVLMFSAVPAKAGRLEAGSFVTTDTISGPRVPTPVVFQQPFDSMPIVVAISDQQGGNSASIRITNITTSGFDALVIEPDNFDGRHIPQNIMYIAIEPGRHILPGGTAIEAGLTNTSAVQRGPGVSGTSSFTNVSFSQPLAANATVLAQIQTANSETRNVPTQSSRPHITALAVNANTAGFQLALERSQAAIGTVQSEAVGWIAFPSSANERFPDINGNDVQWGALNSGNIIRGWSDGCFNVPLPISSATRIAVAKKRTRFNADGGWFRYCALGSGTIGLRVEEDTDQDNERSVPSGDAESAAIIAFSRPFHANLRAQLEVTKVSATVAGTSLGDFSLPGAVREYVVTIRNTGNAPPDPASIIISDLLPDPLVLLANDLAAAGDGPVEVILGTGASALDYDFAGLGAANDSLVFFDQNGSPITPVVNSEGEAIDVARLQIQPFGILEGNRGSGPGEFTLRYRAVIE